MKLKETLENGHRTLKDVLDETWRTLDALERLRTQGVGRADDGDDQNNCLHCKNNMSSCLEHSCRVHLSFILVTFTLDVV